jgi:hypothetical protein
MNTQYFDLNRYKSGRSVLLLVGIFTAVNCLLQAMNVKYQLLYAATLPQIGLALRYTFAVYGIPPFVSIGLLTVIPIALYFICYFLSKKDPKWMIVGLVLFILDTIGLIVFWAMSKFSMEFLLNLGFQGLILFELISAILASRKLNGNIEEVENEVEQQQSRVFDEEQELYLYDKQYAKQHKAAKGGTFVGLIIGYIALFMLGIILMAALNNTLGNILFGITMIGSVALFIVGLIKIAPFVNASTFAYFQKDGQLWRTSAANAAFAQSFNNLQVFEEKADCYLCSYDDGSGRQRKITIPKAYPGLEEILK